MSLETTQRNPALPQYLFDQGAECFKVVRPHEPDLSVDGFGHASIFERMLGLFGKRRSPATQQAARKSPQRSAN